MILTNFNGRFSAKTLVLLSFLMCSGVTAAQPLLTVKQVMNAIITPSTGVIWGAYELKTDAQWKAVENAALSVIAAGDLLKAGGTLSHEQEMAQQAQWLEFNQQMIQASRKVLEAVAAKDEEALFSAGNDALYPPCESCHQLYQNQ